MKQENVNHPSHYNQHPAGIECINIIRHYTCDIANALEYLWRAGLKPELGKEDAEKEIEDLKKALWYISDYYQTATRFTHLMAKDETDDIIYEVTGYVPSRIYGGFPKHVSDAIHVLLYVGIIFQGEVRHVVGWRDNLKLASRTIQDRIDNITELLGPSPAYNS